ncbi:PLDc N-terminal domain-containing protein [Kutzneria kofuensis]|uniref:Cardiolipin synthase N-terminal domain-containing protein n=1 Tax=Kutzneria kofuensis TaxID=103725 RepID=A0A7W9KHU4_9PSEU|nr:PLDc N-terminal domain-containing protein [Kutzneria kofuensis]MBB5892811.1 hypothetical protein [Kutzneria kofuensis]
MLYFDGAVGVAIFCLWIFCLVDVIVTDDSVCRHLPKMLWLLVVLLLPLVGSILWLAVGKPRFQTRGYPTRGTSQFPEYDRPGRHVAGNPDDDAEFLRRCRERAEEQRRRAKEQGL